MSQQKLSFYDTLLLSNVEDEQLQLQVQGQLSGIVQSYEQLAAAYIRVLLQGSIKLKNSCITPVHTILPRYLAIGAQSVLAHPAKTLASQLHISDVVSVVHALTDLQLRHNEEKENGRARRIIQHHKCAMGDSFTVNVLAQMEDIFREVSDRILGRPVTSLDITSLGADLPASTGFSTERSDPASKVVLVHCSRGISRSATLALLIIVYYMFVSVPQDGYCYEDIRQRFPINFETILRQFQKIRHVYPNVSFSLQLMTLCDALRAILEAEEFNLREAKSPSLEPSTPGLEPSSPRLTGSPRGSPKDNLPSPVIKPVKKVPVQSGFGSSTPRQRDDSRAQQSPSKISDIPLPKAGADDHSVTASPRVDLHLTPRGHKLSNFDGTVNSAHFKMRHEQFWTVYSWVSKYFIIPVLVSECREFLKCHVRRLVEMTDSFLQQGILLNTLKKSPLKSLNTFADFGIVFENLNVYNIMTSLFLRSFMSERTNENSQIFRKELPDEKTRLMFPVGALSRLTNRQRGRAIAHCCFPKLMKLSATEWRETVKKEKISMHSPRLQTEIEDPESLDNLVELAVKKLSHFLATFKQYTLPLLMAYRTREELLLMRDALQKQAKQSTKEVQNFEATLLIPSELQHKMLCYDPARDSNLTAARSDEDTQAQVESVVGMPLSARTYGDVVKQDELESDHATSRSEMPHVSDREIEKGPRRHLDQHERDRPQPSPRVHHEAKRPKLDDLRYDESKRPRTPESVGEEKMIAARRTPERTSTESDSEHRTRKRYRPDASKFGAPDQPPEYDAVRSPREPRRGDKPRQRVEKDRFDQDRDRKDARDKHIGKQSRGHYMKEEAAYLKPGIHTRFDALAAAKRQKLTPGTLSPATAESPSADKFLSGGEDLEGYQTFAEDSYATGVEDTSIESVTGIRADSREIEESAGVASSSVSGIPSSGAEFKYEDAKEETDFLLDKAFITLHRPPSRKDVGIKDHMFASPYEPGTAEDIVARGGVTAEMPRKRLEDLKARRKKTTTPSSASSSAEKGSSQEIKVPFKTEASSSESDRFPSSAAQPPLSTDQMKPPSPGVAPEAGSRKKLHELLGSTDDLIHTQPTPFSTPSELISESKGQAAKPKEAEDLSEPELASSPLEKQFSITSSAIQSSIPKESGVSVSRAVEVISPRKISEAGSAHRIAGFGKAPDTGQLVTATAQAEFSSPFPIPLAAPSEPPREIVTESKEELRPADVFSAIEDPFRSGISKPSARLDTERGELHKLPADVVETYGGEEAYEKRHQGRTIIPGIQSTPIVDAVDEDSRRTKNYLKSSFSIESAGMPAVHSLIQKIEKTAMPPEQSRPVKVEGRVPIARRPEELPPSLSDKKAPGAQTIPKAVVQKKASEPKKVQAPLLTSKKEVAKKSPSELNERPAVRPPTGVPDTITRSMSLNDRVEAARRRLGQIPAAGAKKGVITATTTADQGVEPTSDEKAGGIQQIASPQAQSLERPSEPEPVAKALPSRISPTPSEPRRWEPTIPSKLKKAASLTLASKKSGEIVKSPARPRIPVPFAVFDGKVRPSERLRKATAASRQRQSEDEYYKALSSIGRLSGSSTQEDARLAAREQRANGRAESAKKRKVARPVSPARAVPVPKKHVEPERGLAARIRAGELTRPKSMKLGIRKEVPFGPREPRDLPTTVSPGWDIQKTVHEPLLHPLFKFVPVHTHTEPEDRAARGEVPVSPRKARDLTTPSSPRRDIQKPVIEALIPPPKFVPIRAHTEPEDRAARGEVPVSPRKARDITTPVSPRRDIQKPVIEALIPPPKFVPVRAYTEPEDRAARGEVPVSPRKARDITTPVSPRRDIQKQVIEALIPPVKFVPVRTHTEPEDRAARGEVPVSPRKARDLTTPTSPRRDIQKPVIEALVPPPKFVPIRTHTEPEDRAARGEVPVSPRRARDITTPVSPRRDIRKPVIEALIPPPKFVPIRTHTEPEDRAARGEVPASPRKARDLAAPASPRREVPKPAEPVAKISPRGKAGVLPAPTEIEVEERKPVAMSPRKAAALELELEGATREAAGKPSGREFDYGELLAEYEKLLKNAFVSDQGALAREAQWGYYELKLLFEMLSRVELRYSQEFQQQNAAIQTLIWDLLRYLESEGDYSRLKEGGRVGVRQLPESQNEILRKLLSVLYEFKNENSFADAAVRISRMRAVALAVQLALRSIDPGRAVSKVEEIGEVTLTEVQESADLARQKALAHQTAVEFVDSIKLQEWSEAISLAKDTSRFSADAVTDQLAERLIKELQQLETLCPCRTAAEESQNEIMMRSDRLLDTLSQVAELEELEALSPRKAADREAMEPAEVADRVEIETTRLLLDRANNSLDRQLSEVNSQIDEYSELQSAARLYNIVVQNEFGELWGVTLDAQDAVSQLKDLRRRVEDETAYSRALRAVRLMGEELMPHAETLEEEIDLADLEPTYPLVEYAEVSLEPAVLDRGPLVPEPSERAVVEARTVVLAEPSEHVVVADLAVKEIEPLERPSPPAVEAAALREAEESVAEARVSMEKQAVPVGKPVSPARAVVEPSSPAKPVAEKLVTEGAKALVRTESPAGAEIVTEQVVTEQVVTEQVEIVSPSKVRAAAVISKIGSPHRQPAAVAASPSTAAIKRKIAATKAEKEVVSPTVMKREAVAVARKVEKPPEDIELAGMKAEAAVSAAALPAKKKIAAEMLAREVKSPARAAAVISKIGSPPRPEEAAASPSTAAIIKLRKVAEAKAEKELVSPTVITREAVTVTRKEVKKAVPDIELAGIVPIAPEMKAEAAVSVTALPTKKKIAAEMKGLELSEKELEERRMSEMKRQEKVKKEISKKFTTLRKEVKVDVAETRDRIYEERKAGERGQRPISDLARETPYNRQTAAQAAQDLARSLAKSTGVVPGWVQLRQVGELKDIAVQSRLDIGRGELRGQKPTAVMDFAMGVQTLPTKPPTYASQFREPAEEKLSEQEVETQVKLRRIDIKAQSEAVRREESQRKISFGSHLTGGLRMLKQPVTPIEVKEADDWVVRHQSPLGPAYRTDEDRRALTKYISGAVSAEGELSTSDIDASGRRRVHRHRHTRRHHHRHHPGHHRRHLGEEPHVDSLALFERSTGFWGVDSGSVGLEETSDVQQRVSETRSGRSYSQGANGRLGWRQTEVVRRVYGAENDDDEGRWMIGPWHTWRHVRNASLARELENQGKKTDRQGKSP